jgi:hypothetical protein
VESHRTWLKPAERRRDNLESKDGSQIKNWRDLWLPRPLSRRITLKKGRCRLKWVSELMVLGRREWNEQLLRTCLYPHDVAEVMKIRLPDRDEEDFVAWHNERSGIFTVKSAYNLTLRIEYEEIGTEGSSSRADGSQCLYKALWNAKVPHKVQLFA